MKMTRKKHKMMPNTERKNGGIYKNCSHCGKEIYVQRRNIREHNFCNPVCHNNSEYQKERVRQQWLFPKERVSPELW